MTDRTDEFEFVGFWKRVLAALIDAAIGLPFIPLGMYISSWEIAHRSIGPGLLWSVLWVSVWLWPVVRFGGTPGKLLIGVRIIDAHGRYLSLDRALRRVVFPHMLLHLFSALTVWKVVSTYPDATPISTLLERGTLMYTYGQPFVTVSDILTYALLVDIGMVAFNHKKRAIHDFIAGSYVITKDSYTALSESSSDDDVPEFAPHDRQLIETEG